MGDTNFHNRILLSIGRFSRWQLLIYAMLSFGINISWPMHALGIVFTGGEPPHKCVANETLEALNLTTTGTCDVTDHVTNKTSKCSKWAYDEEYGNTIVSEWDLVCDRDGEVPFTQLIFGLGVLFGAPLWTFLADKLGRKPILIFCQVSCMSFSCINALAPNLVLFTTWRFFLSACGVGYISIGCVYIMELFPSDVRVIAGIAFEAIWSLGMLIFALMAYLIREWRWLQFASSIAPLYVVSYIWLLPESVIWLVDNGETEAAAAVLQSAWKCNGTANSNETGDLLTELKNQSNVDEEAEKVVGDWSRTWRRFKGLFKAGEKRSKEGKSVEQGDAHSDNQGRNYGTFDLLRSCTMLRITTGMCLLWFVNNCLYYGLSLSTSSLYGDRFINFCISALAEIPPILLSIPLVKRFGRCKPTGFFHIAVSLLFLATILLHGRVNPTWLTVLGLLAKLNITGSFDILVLYTPEVFPTNLRAYGYGLSVVAGRVGGGLLAPFYGYMGKKVWWLPTSIAAVLSFFAAVVVLVFMPETQHRSLPTTIEEVEDWGKKKSKKLDADDNENEPV